MQFVREMRGESRDVKVHFHSGKRRNVMENLECECGSLSRRKSKGMEESVQSIERKGRMLKGGC